MSRALEGLAACSKCHGNRGVNPEQVRLGVDSQASSCFPLHCGGPSSGSASLPNWWASLCPQVSLLWPLLPPAPVPGMKAKASSSLAHEGVHEEPASIPFPPLPPCAAHTRAHAQTHTQRLYRVTSHSSGLCVQPLPFTKAAVAGAPPADTQLLFQALWPASDAGAPPCLPGHLPFSGPRPITPASPPACARPHSPWLTPSFCCPGSRQAQNQALGLCSSVVRRQAELPPSPNTSAPGSPNPVLVYH